jgi:hypothetical protein
VVPGTIGVGNLAAAAVGVRPTLVGMQIGVVVACLLDSSEV